MKNKKHKSNSPTRSSFNVLRQVSNLASSPKRVGDFDVFFRELMVMVMLVKPCFQQPRVRQSFFPSPPEGFSLTWHLWPEAEDKALRGRNLSAVFRTLYRQVGERCKTFPSCAHTWRVENQCDKSTVRTANGFRIHREPPKRTSPRPKWQAACRSGSLSAGILRRANHRLVFE